MQRRTLIESISEEEREFIDAGKPQRVTEPTVKEDPATVRETSPPVPKDEPAAPKKPAASKKATAVAAAPTVLLSQTYRLPEDLVKELTKTAVNRKLARTAPWSQEDIVAEALREWFHKHASKHASM
jgi:hypothetical protein